MKTIIVIKSNQINNKIIDKSNQVNNEIINKSIK